LKWSPSIGFGIGRSELLGKFPPPQRIALRWQERSFGFRTNQQKSGWCLPLDDLSLLCLSEQAIAPSDAIAGTIFIEVAGQSLRQDIDFTVHAVGEASPVDKNSVPSVNPYQVVQIRLRRPLPVEISLSAVQQVQLGTNAKSLRNVIVIQDRVQESVNIDASRMSFESGRWKVDDTVTLNEDMHGLPVIDAETSKILGLLVSKETSPFVSLANPTP
jgi:hypothetical protein